MIIVTRFIHQEAWYTTTCVPDDYLLGTSESGYNNNGLTIKWLVHFERFSGKRQSRSDQLLPLDGFGSHTTK